MTVDARRFAPSAARNREPILRVLRQYLPEEGLVLEIASGSGEHALYFAQASGPGLFFQPTDPDAGARTSIDAWRTALGLPNVRSALSLDAALDEWPVTQADVVVAINMIHIAPWAAARGLMQGAARVLGPGGVLFLYGPYRVNGGHTAPSNEAFDRDLKSKNPEWGVRDLGDVTAIAEAHGFAKPLIHTMPANNLSLVFKRL